MAVAHTRWRTGNRSRYIPVKLTELENVMFDVGPELTPGDYILNATNSSPAEINLIASVVNQDTDQNYPGPHRVIVRFSALELGTYTLTITINTNQGLKIVKHFDVLVER